MFWSKIDDFEFSKIEIDLNLEDWYNFYLSRNRMDYFIKPILIPELNNIAFLNINYKTISRKWVNTTFISFTGATTWIPIKINKIEQKKFCVWVFCFLIADL